MTLSTVQYFCMVLQDNSHVSSKTVWRLSYCVFVYISNPRRPVELKTVKYNILYNNNI